MFAEAQKEHRWLDQLVGDWTFAHECTMPDGTQVSNPGTMECRMLGDLWLICESRGRSDDHGEWSAIMTLGFDPAQGQYIGTFIGSMMTHIWLYRGRLDASGMKLPMATEGPKFDGSGMGQYRDTIEILDGDTWVLSSELLTDEGTWVQFMQGKHLRA